MSDDPTPPQNGGERRETTREWTLKPTYKQDNPNPHDHNRGMGRSQLPTPATLAGEFWYRFGIESHLVLSVAILPIVALLTYLYSIGVGLGPLGIFIASISLAYGIYYSWAPRESKHVIARLENVYNRKRFAIISSGIAVISVGSTLVLIGLLILESHLPVKIVETSITIATLGMGVGLLCSYVLIRVLVARALPIQSNKPLLDRVVDMGPVVELVFICAALGAPLFIFAAQFLWNQPALIHIDTTLSQEAAEMLLAGFAVLYTALITRM